MISLTYGDPARGVPFPNTRSDWSDAPDTSLLAGGAAGRLPTPDARRIHTDIANRRLLDAANAFVPGNPRYDRASVGLGAFDPESLDDVLGWPAAERTLGDPGLRAPVVIDLRNIYDPQEMAEADVTYISLGRGTGETPLAAAAAE